MFAFKVLEIKFDFLHVMFQITGRPDYFRALDQFLLIVNAIKMDGQPGLQCDVIESFLPVRIQTPGTLGSDTELEPVCMYGIAG